MKAFIAIAFLAIFSPGLTSGLRIDMGIEENSMNFDKVKDISKRVLRKIFGKNDPGRECRKRKEEHLNISAEDGISPAKTFGYPEYFQKVNMTKVSPGVALSYLYGHSQPIKLGVRDFFVQGNADELEAFLECFKDYQIFGSFLDDDGHWKEHQQHPVFMQIQNLDAIKGSMSRNAAEIMIRQALHKVVSSLNVDGIVGDHMSDLVGMDFLSAMEKVKKATEIYTTIKDSFNVVKDILSKEKGKPKKVVLKKILNYFSGEAQKTEKRDKWDGFENVDIRSKMEIKFTMYPSPIDRVRATFKFSHSHVTLEDALNAFDVLIAESPIASILN